MTQTCKILKRTLWLTNLPPNSFAWQWCCNAMVFSETVKTLKLFSKADNSSWDIVLSQEYHRKWILDFKAIVLKDDLWIKKFYPCLLSSRLLVFLMQVLRSSPLSSGDEPHLTHVVTPRRRETCLHTFPKHPIFSPTALCMGTTSDLARPD